MERVGLAASKIARGSLFWYNVCVCLIAFFLALFLFFIAGSAILLALLLLGFIFNSIVGTQIPQQWMAVIRICMLTLTVVISLVTFFVIGKNIKFRKN